MSISQATVLSFKRELFLAIHDFAVDQFKIALYTPDATINVDTTVYAPADEVSGLGYTAGGFNLTVSQVFTSGLTAIAAYENLITGNITVNQIAGGVIYNSDKADAAVCVLDFGRVLSKVAAPLTITFPPADQNVGLIRIQ